MSEILIVRINEKLIPDFQIVYNTKIDSAIKTVLSSWNDIVQNKSQEMIALLSADLILNSQVKIPSKNEEVIRQSIPFAIEEQLANEISENHYAYQQKAENIFLVSVVEKNIIKEISKRIKENGLTCEKLFSESASVPIFNDKLSILIHEDYIIANDSFHNGSILKKESLNSYISLSEIKSKIIFTENSLDIQNEPNRIVKQTDTTLLQAKTISQGDFVNLFQGNFKSGSNEKQTKNPWKNLWILVLTLVVSWVIINFYQLWNLNTEIKYLNNQQTKFLLSVIPNASQTEKNDPYAAIQSFLKGNKNSNDSKQSSGFVSQLYYLGKTLKQYPTVQVQSLRKRSKKLEIKLLASDANVLNQFQSELEKIALSMRVKLGTRNTSKDGVISVLTMEKL